jgi:hypothetical protein
LESRVRLEPGVMVVSSSPRERLGRARGKGAKRVGLGDMLLRYCEGALGQCFFSVGCNSSLVLL